MFPYIFVTLYIVCALGVAFLARRSRMGWFGAFILSLIVTPLIGYILVIGLTTVNRRTKATSD
ncbi:MAG: hypothetical protein AAF580_00950 [Pseudomonadota bacterium]